MNPKQWNPAALRAARCANVGSLRAAAAKLGDLGRPVSRQTVLNHERGDYIPDAAMVGLYARAYGVRVESFYR